MPWAASPLLPPRFHGENRVSGEAVQTSGNWVMAKITKRVVDALRPKAGRDVFV